MTIDEIKAALAERGWTQAQLAEKLHIKTGSLRNILSGQVTLTEQLAAHIELLFKDTQQQLLMYKVTFPDAVCESWLPGWEQLTPEQRKTAIEQVLLKAAEQLAEEYKRKLTGEELELLERFCGSLPVAPVEHHLDLTPHLPPATDYTARRPFA